MRLKSLSYAEFPNTPRSWRVADLTLNSLNLIVGKNASGKSRTLSVLWSLSTLLTGRVRPFTSASYHAVFDDAGSRYEYFLDCNDRLVTSEKLTIDGKSKLVRGAGGIGTISAVQLGQELNFQAPETELASVLRRDKIQHPFLEPLHEWADLVLKYDFGTPLGRDRLGAFLKGTEEAGFDPKDPALVVGTFRQGVKRHGDEFKARIISDMSRLGYHLEDVFLAAPDLVFDGPSGVVGELLALHVTERGRAAPTQQLHMSQGMFRALSLLISLNFAVLELKPSCVLIDDIGEGLDFARSTSLIRLLMEKADDAIQLVMTSNDRFVMNSVPLSSWTILTSGDTGPTANNYNNAKSAFDDFSFTGLNNFDFFSQDFLQEGRLTDQADP